MDHYDEEDRLIEMKRFIFWLKETYVNIGYLKNGSLATSIDANVSHLAALVLGNEWYQIRHDILGPEESVNWYPRLDENGRLKHKGCWPQEP